MFDFTTNYLHVNQGRLCYLPGLLFITYILTKTIFVKYSTLPPIIYMLTRPPFLNGRLYHPLFTG